MKVSNSVLVTIMISMLTACSDNNKTSKAVQNEIKTIIHTGKVIDGYISGAKVCIDTNNSASCDQGEVSAITDNEGVFTLPKVTEAQLNSAPLTAEISENAIDADSNTAVTFAAIYQAPAGSKNLTPITNLTQHMMELGKNRTEAEAAVQALLGTRLATDSDYIAMSKQASVSAKIKEQSDMLHATAHYLHSLQGRSLKQHATPENLNDFSTKELTNLFNHQNIQSMPSIMKDANTLLRQDDAFTAGEPSSSQKTEAENQIKKLALRIAKLLQERKEGKITAAELKKELSKFVGIVNLGELAEENTPQLSYHAEKILPNTNKVTLSTHKLKNGAFAVEPKKISEANLALTSKGWVQPSSAYEIKSINADNSIELHNAATSELAQVHRASSYSLEGIPISYQLRALNLQTWQAMQSDPNKVFSQDSEMLQTDVVTQADRYLLHIKNKCDFPIEVLLANEETNSQKAENKVCAAVISDNQVAIKDKPYFPNRREKTSARGYTINQLDKLFSDTASNGDITKLKGPIVAVQGSSFIIAELLKPNKQVNYYGVWLDNSLLQKAHLYATGTWRQANVHQNDIIELPLPSKVALFSANSPDANKYFTEAELSTKDRFFVVHNKQVRMGSKYQANSVIRQKQQFNQNAFQQLLANTNMLDKPPMPTSHPRLSQCLLDDSKLNQNNSAIHIQPKNYYQFRAATLNCREKPTTLLTPQQISEIVSGKKIVSYDYTGALDEAFLIRANGTAQHVQYSLQNKPTDYNWEVGNNGDISLKAIKGNQHIRMSMTDHQGNYFAVKMLKDNNIVEQAEDETGAISSKVMSVRCSLAEAACGF
ncbi:MAG: hypothetical protein ACPGUD_02250 [Parashewanella sp.]